MKQIISTTIYSSLIFGTLLYVGWLLTAYPFETLCGLLYSVIWVWVYYLIKPKNVTDIDDQVK